MAWLSGWSYRKEITITGQSGAGTDFQVEFDIGDSAGGDLHLEGHCTNFPQDIAITDNDGTTLLDFWIEDITADPLKMWVEVADDLGTNQTIYIYYGKSGATTNSDIENTMIFGDDFSGASLDTTTRWNSYIASGCAISLSGGEATFSTISNNGQYYAAALSQSSFGVDNILECRSKSSVTSNNAFRYMTIGFGPDEYSAAAFYLKTQTAIDDSIWFVDASAGNNTWYTGYSIDGSAPASATDAISTTYKKYTIERYGTDNARWLIDDVEKQAETSTISESTQIALGIDAISGAGFTFDMIVDYIFVRKYNSTEPAFSSAGSEETPPTGVSPTSVFYGPLVGPLGGPI